MSRILPIFQVILCLLWGLAVVAPAQALELSDEAAGYSLTLPDGWAGDNPEKTEEKCLALLTMLVGEDKAGDLLSRNGPGLAAEKEDGAEDVVVFAIPHAELGGAELGLALEELTSLHEEDSPVLEELIRDLDQTLTRSGITAREFVRLRDGVRLSYRQHFADGRTMHRALQFSFSREHLLVLLHNRVTDSESNGETGALLAPSLQIHPGRALVPSAKPGLMSPISSFFAIAGLVVAILVLRRRRLEILRRGK